MAQRENLTIAQALAGDTSGMITAFLCAHTPRIKYSKNNKTEELVKASIRDESGSCAIIVYNTNLFQMVEKGSEEHNSVQITNYRLSNTGSLIVGKETCCKFSKKLTNPYSITEIRDSSYAMYAPIRPLGEVIKADPKTRVSTSGKIIKVKYSDTRAKWITIKDGDTEYPITLWSPHNSIPMEVGKTLRLFDAKKSAFSSGCIDTTIGTLVEVTDTPVVTTALIGEIQGFGHNGTNFIVDILESGKDESTSIPVESQDLLKRMEAFEDEDVSIKFTLKNGSIVDFALEK